jgi:hypothetical protein
MIQLLNPDLTPLTAVEITHFEAGQDSDPIPFWIQNTGPDQTDLLLVLQAENPTTGLTVSQGLPPLDELWAKIRLTGHQGPAAPEITDWLPLGTHRALPIATLPTGSIRTAEIRFHPPSTAATLAWRFTLGVIAAENSYPVGPGLRQGILTGLGDHGHSALLKGFQVTPTTPPTDQVHVAAGHLIYRGRLLGHVGATLTLDQQDAAGETLEPGHSYLALLTAGPTGITITKSHRSPLPVRPSPPPWEPVLAVLEVLAVLPDATTEIDTTHITDLRLFDRYQAEPGTGLHLRLHPGQALAGGTLRRHSTLTDLLLPPTAATSLWQLASGSWSLTPAPAPPPETTALGPLWLINTDAAAVTALQDRRTYATDTVVLHLRGDLPATPGPIADLLIAHDGLILEDVIYRLSSNGGGASGQTKLDLLLEGASIYPSHALDDQRPAWPFDAGDLIQGGRVHEVAELWPGQIVQLCSIEHPASAPVWSDAYLVCKRV